MAHMSCDERWGRWTNVLVCRTVVPTVHFTTLNSWDNCSTLAAPMLYTDALQNGIQRLLQNRRTAADALNPVSYTHLTLPTIYSV